MALTKEDLQAIADLMDVKIGASEQRLKAYIESHVEKEIRQIADGHKMLYEKMEREFGEVHEELDALNSTCALPGFVDSKNEEKTERNAGYLVVSQSGGGMLRQGTREGIRRTPANRGMRAHRIVKGLDISEDVCHGMCP